MLTEFTNNEIYYRKLTKREPINGFGKLGYVLYYECFKPTDFEKVKLANYRKKIKFEEVETYNKHLYDYFNKVIQRPNTVYTIQIDRTNLDR